MSRGRSGGEQRVRRILDAEGLKYQVDGDGKELKMSVVFEPISAPTGRVFEANASRPSAPVPSTAPDAVRAIITQHTVAAGSVGAGAFLLTFADAPAVYAIWGTMFFRIAEECGHPITKPMCLKIATGIGSSVSAYYLGSKILTWTVNLIPGLGQLGAGAANMVLNAYYTNALGKCFHGMLRDQNINGRTAYELGKICLRTFNPFPSLSEMKGIFGLLKHHQEHA